MLLTDGEIKEMMGEEIVIEGFDDEFLQPSSYDMRIGKKALVSHSDTESDVEKNGSVVIKPGEFALLTTHEGVKLAPNITGHIGVKSYYTRKGVVLLAGLQIDPGFEGHLVLGLYNAAPRQLVLDYLSPFCTVEFHKLSRNVEKPYISKGEQTKGQIPQVDKDYLRTLETQSLSDVAESVRLLTANMGEMNRWMKQIFFPILLLIFAAIVGSFFK
jgi:dCTP deaminase